MITWPRSLIVMLSIMYGPVAGSVGLSSTFPMVTLIPAGSIPPGAPSSSPACRPPRSGVLDLTNWQEYLLCLERATATSPRQWAVRSSTASARWGSGAHARHEHVSIDGMVERTAVAAGVMATFAR
jgi:hypothetical protein